MGRSENTETWELDGKTLPRSKVEEILAKRCRWWWRRSKSAHLIWDPVGFITKSKSKWGKLWKQKRELLAFRWEMARRGLPDEQPKPWVERPQNRMAFEVDFTFGPLYQLSELNLARSNAGSGLERFWAEQQRKIKEGGAPVQRESSRGDSWLVIVDQSYSEEEILRALRSDKRSKRIPDLTGSDSTSWGKAPWRWPELLDIAAAVKTPRFNPADRKKLSSARAAAATYAKHLIFYMRDV